jgi:hypothetical protein
MRRPRSLQLDEQVECALPRGRSITVARVARDLDTDPSTVRRLVRAGELVAHRIGLGSSRPSIRIYVESVEAYRIRQQVKGRAPEAAAAPKRHLRYNGEHQKAIAALAAAGVRVKK